MIDRASDLIHFSGPGLPDLALLPLPLLVLMLPSLLATQQEGHKEDKRVACVQGAIAGLNAERESVRSMWLGA